MKKKNISLKNGELKNVMLSWGLCAAKWRNFKMPSILVDSILIECNLITENGPEWKALFRLLTKDMINSIVDRNTYINPALYTQFMIDLRVKLTR